MTEIQPWLVTGQGGSRIDFVAGWLSCLPNFVNNNWSVDPNTGQSVGEMRLMKQLDYENITLSAHLANVANLVATDTATKWCGTIHGYNIHNQIDVDNVVIVYIDVPQSSLSKVQWEFCVKTFLTGKHIGAIKNTVSVDVVEQQLRNVKTASIPKPHKLARILDYEQLFVAGGSRYLCDSMNLTATDRLHKFYDTMLEWADSPLEITALGKTWKFSDYF